MYSDEDLAALCDVLDPRVAGDDPCLPHVMAADSVLDVGRGTGALLHRARREGHTGRLCGVDPDVTALGRARTRRDVEWCQGRAEDMGFRGEFALASMAGNVFQQFVTDAAQHAALTAVRTALREDGRLVFGTRDPRARAWERWTPDHATEVVDHHGRALRVEHRVESVEGGVVTLTETIADRDGAPVRVDRGVLRFTGVEEIDRLLTATGFRVHARFGDGGRGPLTDASREIVTVARPV
ncbi:trans-aconitate 2-methyltransferase [Nocardiopsis sp. MG754419]|uniref:class I SAM-dependent methyltransferase n=1 Tax=Nocardiopsis sp. MG754419 TaxID=2259865 RepID=UPI001BAA6EDF|nr:class I SAM-dependent methyltransferase [Nocardiopsis sp. MG754419]MBR8744840.1 SAM-dependent methyltransferase [Nocardiopsis sp. MG754419]